MACYGTMLGIDLVTKANLGWQGKQHIHYKDLHKKYGDIVRVGASRSTLGFELASIPSLHQDQTR